MTELRRTLSPQMNSVGTLPLASLAYESWLDFESVLGAPGTRNPYTLCLEVLRPQGHPPQHAEIRVHLAAPKSSPLQPVYTKKRIHAKGQNGEDPTGTSLLRLSARVGNEEAKAAKARAVLSCNALELLRLPNIQLAEA